MSQSVHIQQEPPPVAPPRRRGWPLLAWLLILAAVAFILWRYSTVSPLEKQRYDLVNMRLQGRYLVGVDEVLGGKNTRAQLYEQAKDSLNRGTYAQRLRFAVLAGELKGPDEAHKQLRQLNERYHKVCGDPPAEEAEIARTLDQLYTARAENPKETTSLSEEQQDELRRQLGWFGDLALAPPSDDSAARAAVIAPARRTAWSLLSVLASMGGIGLAGLFLLILLAVLYFLNRLPGGLTRSSPHHGIYAETFALYMLLFLGLSIGIHYLVDWLSLREGSLALSGLAALGSLAALGWPVLRGIPWRQVRHDIGWHTGRRPWLEPFLGVACYAMALPMLVAGALVFVLLTKLRDHLGLGPEEFGPSNAPGHPIVFWAGRTSWWVWLEVLFVASVAAPIVEETMFRGVLYRHLRSASSALRPALSVFFSVVVVSFLFAVIHPQGVLAVPMLMGLALAFTLVREWRDTLVPPMIAHGINNAVATVLMFLMR